MNCRAKCSSLLCWLAVTNESLKHFYQSCHFVGHSGRYPQHSILPLRHRNAAVGLASYGVVVVVLRPLPAGPQSQSVSGVQWMIDRQSISIFRRRLSQNEFLHAFTRRGAQDEKRIHWRVPVETRASRVRRSPVDHPATRSVVVPCALARAAVVIVVPVVTVNDITNHDL